MRKETLSYGIEQRRSLVKWGEVAGILSIFLLLPPFISIPIIISFLVTKTNTTRTQYYTYETSELFVHLR